MKARWMQPLSPWEAAFDCSSHLGLDCCTGLSMPVKRNSGNATSSAKADHAFMLGICLQGVKKSSCLEVHLELFHCDNEGNCDNEHPMYLQALLCSKNGMCCKPMNCPPAQMPQSINQLTWNRCGLTADKQHLDPPVRLPQRTGFGGKLLWEYAQVVLQMDVAQNLASFTLNCCSGSWSGIWLLLPSLHRTALPAKVFQFYLSSVLKLQKLMNKHNRFLLWAISSQKARMFTESFQLLSASTDF